jgi:hypothetical protein
MENIWIHKRTETQKGYVEYLLAFNNPIMCGREPNDRHIETEPFENLAGLISLLDIHTQTTLCRTYLADAIQIHRIVMQGEDEERNKTELTLDNSGIKGNFSVSVSIKETVSRSSELLLYTEYKLQQLLQMLTEENQKPKSEEEK